MSETVDVRGRACPEPVIRTKAMLARPDCATFTVLVDNPEARDNVERMARQLKAQVEIDEKDGVFHLLIIPSDSSDPGPDASAQTPEESSSGSPGGNTLVLFVPSLELGTGDSRLGTLLTKAAVKTIKELNPLPDSVVFMNEGVKLCCEDSPVLKAVQELESKGIEILVCGTCLDFYDLKASRKAGRVSNMYEILSTLSNADKLVRL